MCDSREGERERGRELYPLDPVKPLPHPQRAICLMKMENRVRRPRRRKPRPTPISPVPGQPPPGRIPPRRLPPGRFPLGQFPPGQFPTLTIAPQTIPTRTIANNDNCPPENSHSGEFPTLTIAPQTIPTRTIPNHEINKYITNARESRTKILVVRIFNFAITFFSGELGLLVMLI